MEAIRLRARVSERSTLEWLEPLPHLPEGEVEVILLYERKQSEAGQHLASEWPALDGGNSLGGTLRREDIYDDER